MSPHPSIVPKASWTHDVTWETLSNPFCDRLGASPEMAVTVLESFGGTPDICPGMKMAHDLVKIRDEADAICVKPGEHIGDDCP